MTVLSPVAILGGGAWGAALAMQLARSGSPVRLWDHDANRLKKLAEVRTCFDVPFSDNLSIEMSFAKAVEGIEDIGLVVPSYAFRDVLLQLKPLVSKNTRLFWGTKGLDPQGALLHTLIAEVFSPETPAAVLSGPSFAREVAKGFPTAISLAGNNADFNAALTRRFSSDIFRVAPTTDWVGVQLCSVVKNVVAIAVGISDGQLTATNTRCAIIAQGLSEMAALIAAMGGERDTALSFAGAGDLILTATDDQSRNRRFGLAIGRGQSAEAALKSIGESVEGYYNAQQLHHLARQHQVTMPIATLVYQILYENLKTTCFFKELIK